MSVLFAGFFMQDHSDCILQGKSCQKSCSKEQIPLPKCVHRVLTKQELGNDDVAVIGDVHGCLNELKTLIRKANELTDERCKFIFCGDLVNKGPYSKETLDFVKSLGSKAYVVRGNNEDHVIKHYLALNKDPNYTNRLKKKFSWIPSLTDDDVKFLVDLPYTITIPHLNCVVVHAGLNPYLPLCRQNVDNMVEMRNMSGVDNVCGVQEEQDIHKGFPWASLWTGSQHVYFGHDARRNLQIYPYATGLDTGCVYGRKLTAKFLTGDQQYITVDAEMNYNKTK